MTSNAGYKKKICYYYDGMLKFILLSSFKVIRLICVFISSSVAHKRFDTTEKMVDQSVCVSEKREASKLSFVEQ